MLEGFGQAPICLQLDLDSYDGPWTHVERFRGRSGWLVVAEARVTTSSCEWTTTLVAACDAYGEAVPHFMAPNLLGCACSHPQPCDELPPQELDELLDDAAHQLRVSWLRENDRGLLALSRAGADRIAAMEAATRAVVDTADRQIADLRRRRRMPGVTVHAAELFNEAITGIEVDRETALHRLAEQRAQVRRAIQDEEMALLRRTSVRVTWEPLYHVNWSAAGRISEDELAVRDHIGSRRHSAGEFAHNARGGRGDDIGGLDAKLAAHFARAANPQKEAPPAVDNWTECEALSRRTAKLVRQLTILQRNKVEPGRGYKIRWIGARRDLETLRDRLGEDAGDTPSGALLTEAARLLDEAETMLLPAAPAQTPPPPALSTAVPCATPASAVARISPAQPVATAVPVLVSNGEPATPPTVPTAIPPHPQSTVAIAVPAGIESPRPANGKLKLERDGLARQLVALETTGQKFLRGSPKFERNRVERADLAERIRILDANLAGSETSPLAAQSSLYHEKAELEAALARHEKRGARPSDGMNPYQQYRDQRLNLLGRIAELNARIAREERRVSRA